MSKIIKLGPNTFVKEPVRCPKCDKLFKNKRALEMHNKTHKDK